MLVFDLEKVLPNRPSDRYKLTKYVVGIASAVLLLIACSGAEKEEPESRLSGVLDRAGQELDDALGDVDDRLKEATSPEAKLGIIISEACRLLEDGVEAFDDSSAREGLEQLYENIIEQGNLQDKVPPFPERIEVDC